MEAITREEIFMAAAAGENVIPPEPITRREKFLNAIYDRVSMGGITQEQLQEAVDDYFGRNPLEGEFVKTVNGIAPDENGNVVVSGGVVPTVEPADDDIPKVFFGGALQQTKDEKLVPFRYISKTEDISGYAEIKAQGNSSMSYPKKNQTVKMFADEACETKMKADFKGWGKQNKHCYKANWIDLSHARNVVSARLWADIVKSRANYAELPELLRTSPNHGAVDGFPVKVYADGVYQGRYTLNIPKDKWAFNMDDSLDNHCVLYGENYVSGCFRASANINGSDWSDEIHDSVPASIKTRWNEVISFVMNSTDEEFRANLGNYFYVDSLIDYHLFGLASCGLDAYGKNQLYMTYDGQRWIASMYDMDSTWGLYWDGSKFVANDYARTSYEDYVSTQSSGEGNLLYIRLEQLFWEELQTRWAELKAGALSIDNIINRFERFTDIAPADLVKEDYASTTGGGKFTGIPSQSTNNIQQIRVFALARQAWTDEYVSGLTPVVPVPCTGITLSETELTFDDYTAQTITATLEPENATDSVSWVSSDTSVATVIGGVVSPVSNGNATITATAGSVSASCGVSVAIPEIELGEDVNVGISFARGKGVDDANGELTDNENGFYTEDYIEVIYPVFTIENITHTWHSVAYYDAEKQFISGQNGSNPGVWVAPNTAKYVRMAFWNGSEVDATITFKASVATWSSTATYKFTTTGEIQTSGGNAYLSSRVAVPDGTTAVYLANRYTASYTWKEMVAYDADGNFLKKYNNDEGKVVASKITDMSGVAYVQCTAYPDNVATNNVPNNQLTLVFI